MSALHIINRSSALPSCLEVAAVEDSILLIQDGVYAATTGSMLDQARHHAPGLFVLAEDAQLRGITHRLHESVRSSSYADFVTMVVAHHPIISWR